MTTARTTTTTMLTTMFLTLLLFIFLPCFILSLRRNTCQFFYTDFLYFYAINYRRHPFMLNKSLIITEETSNPALAGTKDMLLGARVFTTGSSSEYTTVRLFIPLFLS